MKAVAVLVLSAPSRQIAACIYLKLAACDGLQRPSGSPSGAMSSVVSSSLLGVGWLLDAAWTQEERP